MSASGPTVRTRPMTATEPTDDSRMSITTSRSTATLAELDTDPFDLRSIAPPGAVVELFTEDPLLVVAAIRALDGFASEVTLRPPTDLSEADCTAPIETTRCSASRVALVRQDLEEGRGETRWVLLTSGTSGTPREISHSMSSLMPRIMTDRLGSHRSWGLLFDPIRMAGIQVLTHAIGTGAGVIAPDSRAALAEKIAFLVENGVNALSATPTLWRRILQLPNTTSWALDQVTLGGEIADQSVLDALRRRFPDARITHVFAATETGAVFSVSDGLEGFPVRQLEGSTTGAQVEIRDSVLYVHSPRSSAAEEDGFVCTGDVVEIRGDRVFFQGRNTGVVNIGGQSIWPEVVEAVLRTHPSVDDARVSAVANSIAGNLLVADVTTNAAIQPGDLRRWVRERTSPPHVPARVRIVDTLETGPTGKLIR